MGEIKNKIEFQGIVVNRIPAWAKDYIKSRAKEEFADDYGALLSFLIRETQEYEILKSKFFNNDLQVQLIQNPQENSEEKVPRSLSGQKLNIKKGGNR